MSHSYRYLVVDANGEWSEVDIEGPTKIIRITEDEYDRLRREEIDLKDTKPKVVAIFYGG